jgi:hypothetical protein
MAVQVTDYAKAFDPLDILRFQIGHFIEYLLRRQPWSQELQYIRYADPHATNTRPAPALLGIDGDAIGYFYHFSFPAKGKG